MAPRRGGEAGAGIQVSSHLRKNGFEPPPLRRQFPWQQDGSGNCDLIAGGVDASGIFKGIYISGVHMMALLRTFQLSKAFMPIELSQPAAKLGENLRDGVPVIIVTRGCFGRALDYGPGPQRNDIQQAVWEEARKFRAEMPQVPVTCIDVPAHVSSDVIQACLDPPLAEYRELMYQDGTWFTPVVHNASGIQKWMADNQRFPDKPFKSGDQQAQFKRTKFGWTSDEKLYGNSWVIGWKPVLQVKNPANIPARTDLVFTDGNDKADVKVVTTTGPSSAECTLRKALAKAREPPVSAGELLAAVKAYAPRATVRETASIQESMQVCEDVSATFQARGEPIEAFTAKSLLVRFHILLSDVEEAKKVAASLRHEAPNAKLELEAVKLQIACLYELVELDQALELAHEGKALAEKKEDPEALKTAFILLEEAYRAKGEDEEADRIAASARKLA